MGPLALVSSQADEIVLRPGEALPVSLGVYVPPVVPRADMVFSFDATGSMEGIIASAKAQAGQIMAALDALGVDMSYGVVSYMDYPHEYTSYDYTAQYGSAAAGDYAYRLDQGVTADRAATQAAINGLTLGYGGDGPQDYARIFYESYADPNVAWRPGARRILLNFGDNVPHDNNLNEGVPGTACTWSTGGDPGRDETMFTADDLDLQAVLAGMVANKVTLLEAHFASAGTAQWTHWAALTGGEFFRTLPSTLAGDVVKTVTALLTPADVQNLHLTTTPGYEAWLVAAAPAAYSGTRSVTVPFDAVLQVPDDAPCGLHEFELVAVDSDGVAYAALPICVRVTRGLPPVADAGDDQVAEQGHANGAEVTLDGSGSCDPDDDPLTYTWAEGDTVLAGPTAEPQCCVVLGLGAHAITLTVDDGTGLTCTDQVIVTVRDSVPPALVAPADAAAEQASPNGTVVDLGQPLVLDVCDAGPAVTNDAPAVFPLGQTTVTWTATDASGNVATAAQKVVVVDTTRPEIESAWATPAVLWQPDHRMVEVVVQAILTDACDAAPAFRIAAVASSEPVSGPGSGNTSPDWEITGDYTVSLRAERCGNSRLGRVYTITLQATDASGNASTADVLVTVPHDNGNRGGGK